MGRGKRTATLARGTELALSTSDGRTRLAPRIRPPYSEVEEKALFAQLEDVGIPEHTLSADERRQLLNLFVEAEGDQETRVIDSVEEFTELLMQQEEETEQCDRCEHIVRAGQGLYWPPEEYADLVEGSDEERLCQDCYDKALIGFEMETAMGDGQDVLEGRGRAEPRRG